MPISNRWSSSSERCRILLRPLTGLPMHRLISYVSASFFSFRWTTPKHEHALHFHLNRQPFNAEPRGYRSDVPIFSRRRSDEELAYDTWRQSGNGLTSRLRFSLPMPDAKRRPRSRGSVAGKSGPISQMVGRLLHPVGYLSLRMTMHPKPWTRQGWSASVMPSLRRHAVACD